LPAVNPLMLDVVAPVLHKYVALAALVLTDAEPFGVRQLVLATGVQTAVGGVFVEVTVVEHVLVHPVVVLVTVTV
jgi:hypothetical protein